MAQLMFKIANESHADVRAHNETLPAGVAAIGNKALAKNPAERWQDGDMMARALRLCLQSVTPGRLKKPLSPGPRRLRRAEP